METRYFVEPYSMIGPPCLWLVVELKISEGQIIEVEGQPFDDFVETIGVERGDKEFAEIRRRMNEYYLSGAVWTSSPKISARNVGLKNLGKRNGETAAGWILFGGG